MNIGIIGKGNVGSALQRGLQRAGHNVTTVGNEPDAMRQTASAADVVIIAVPFRAVGDAVRELGNTVDGKVLVDATNVIGPERQLAVGFTTSGAEELQKKAPAAHVVKAFNTMFAQHMDSGRVKGETLSAFVASDHPDAKQTVMRLAGDIGFDPIDAGPLRNARLLEPMGYQMIQLGVAVGMGRDIGFKVIR